MHDQEITAKGKGAAKKGRQHGGRFTEGLLDIELILNALNIQPGQTILDAGCGNGYMSKAFSEKLAGSGKVYALDHDRHFMETLRKETKGTHIEVIMRDVTQPVPIRPASVDLIYISTVIHSFSRMQLHAFLDQAKNMLRPGGMLAVVEIEKKETSFGPPLNRRFSPEELKCIVPMSPLNTIQVGEHFYLQLFQNRKKSD